MLLILLKCLIWSYFLKLWVNLVDNAATTCKLSQSIYLHKCFGKSNSYIWSINDLQILSSTQRDLIFYLYFQRSDLKHCNLCSLMKWYCFNEVLNIVSCNQGRPLFELHECSVIHKNLGFHGSFTTKFWICQEIRVKLVYNWVQCGINNNDGISLENSLKQLSWNFYEPDKKSS